MTPISHNRALSAMFRVFGGPGCPLQGDSVWRLAGPGANAPEARVLGVVVPLVVAVAVVERMLAWAGPWWTLLLAVPAVLVVLHAGTIVIGIAAKVPLAIGGGRDAWLWRCWVLVLSAWAVWAWLAGGWVRWVAAGWLALVALELAAAALLGWRGLMVVRGSRGVVLRVVMAVVLHLLMVPLAVYFGWWALAWGGLLGIGWARATFSPNSQGFGRVGTHCDGAGVWLTIDDGPDPDTTPRLLDLLDEHGAKATFFVIGQKVEQHPELAREIVARGHQLGNHTLGHPCATFWGAGPGRTRREIEGGSRVIEEVAGVVPRWFRAPVGHSNFFTHPVTDEAGLQVIGWTRRGLDGVSLDVPAILERLTRGMQRGDIMVMHDARPAAGQVLEGLLERIGEAGLRCELPEEGEPRTSNVERRQPAHRAGAT